MSEKVNIGHGRCPQCARRFTYDLDDEPKWLPFCCERCQWVDLGRWLSEDYRVSRDVGASDEQQQD